MRRLATLLLWLLTVAPASAQIVGTLPYTLQNGTIADANQVMSDLNAIATAVNAGAATAGANSNITSLTGLTTPLVYTAGGTSVYIGGTSSNVSNAYTVASPTPTGFSLISGKVVSFIASATNTGAATLNVAATGALNLYRQAVTGPVAMLGGEIQNGMQVLAMYDGTQYQCLNCVATSVVPTGAVFDFGGPTAPSGYLLANGQAVSRTTYAALNSTLNVTGVSATTTSGSASVVVPNSALFQLGWYVGGNNVTCNVTITAIPDGTHITISANAGASGATTLQIGPWQQGDCSTTFNVPNLTGRMTAGVDGTTNITATTCTNAGSLGALCGAQTHTLTVAEMPAHNHSVTDTHSHQFTFGQQGGIAGGGAITVVTSIQTSGGATAVNTSGTTTGSITINNNGGGGAHQVLNPVAMVYKIIKT